MGMVPIADLVLTSIGVVIVASGTWGSTGRVRFTMMASSSGGVGSTAMAIAVNVETPAKGTSAQESQADSN